MKVKERLEELRKQKYREQMMFTAWDQEELDVLEQCNGEDEYDPDMCIEEFIDDEDDE